MKSSFVGLPFLCDSGVRFILLRIFLCDATLILASQVYRSQKLLLAILDQASEDMFEVAENMFSGDHYQKTLAQFLGQYFGFLQAHKTYLTFQLSLLFQPGLKDIVQETLQRRADHLLSVTEQMFRGAGVNRPDLVARRFIAELDGMALHHLSVFKHYPLAEMQDYIFENYKDIQNDGL